MEDKLISTNELYDRMKKDFNAQGGNVIAFAAGVVIEYIDKLEDKSQEIDNLKKEAYKEGYGKALKDYGII